MENGRMPSILEQIQENPAALSFVLVQFRKRVAGLLMGLDTFRRYGSSTLSTTGGMTSWRLAFSISYFPFREKFSRDVTTRFLGRNSS